MSYRLQILHGNSYELSNQMTKYKSTKSIKSTKSTKSTKIQKTQKMIKIKKKSKRCKKYKSTKKKSPAPAFSTKKQKMLKCKKNKNKKTLRHQLLDKLVRMCHQSATSQPTIMNEINMTNF